MRLKTTVKVSLQHRCVIDESHVFTCRFRRQRLLRRILTTKNGFSFCFVAMGPSLRGRPHVLQLTFKPKFLWGLLTQRVNVGLMSNLSHPCSRSVILYVTILLARNFSFLTPYGASSEIVMVWLYSSLWSRSLYTHKLTDSISCNISVVEMLKYTHVDGLVP